MGNSNFARQALELSTAFLAAAGSVAFLYAIGVMIGVMIRDQEPSPSVPVPCASPNRDESCCVQAPAVSPLDVLCPCCRRRFSVDPRAGSTVAKPPAIRNKEPR